MVIPLKDENPLHGKHVGKLKRKDFHAVDVRKAVDEVEKVAHGKK
jgi:hypothetical protein